MTKENRALTFSERVERGEIAIPCLCQEGVCAFDFAYIKPSNLTKGILNIPESDIPQCIHGKMIPTPRSQASDNLF